MTNVSRSTSSIQANPRILALALAALRLGLILEGPPKLPFPRGKQIIPELSESSLDYGKIEETETESVGRASDPLSSQSLKGSPNA